MTSHPWDLSDRLIAALADCDSVCEHLHLPVQSGSDAVLRRMGRQYTIEHYLERLARIREAVPGHHRLDRHHRRVLRRDRGPVRGDARAARDGPLRPGLRRGLLAATGHAGDPARRRRAGRRQAPPAQRAARAPGGDRPRAQRGVARPGGRGPRRCDPAGSAPTGTTATRRPTPGRHRSLERREPVVGPDPRQQARPPRGRPRRSSVARSPSGSTTPARTRCEARSSARDRRIRRAPPLIVVAGATATGKTELAIRLAEAFIATGRPAAIISADSRQVFRGLDIGTAKATPADRARVAASRPRPRRSRRAVQRGRLRGARARRPGRDRPRRRRSRSWPAAPGSTCARSRAASTPTRCRATRPCAPGSRRSSIDDGLDALVARLRRSRRDSPRRVDLRNPRRVVRALEIAELAGDAPRPAGARLSGPVDLARAHASSPPSHADRIARRARAQFDAGLIDEARALRERFDPTLPAFSAIGYREAWAVLDGRARPATRRSSSTPGATSRSPSASGPGSGRSRTSTGCRSTTACP